MVITRSKTSLKHLLAELVAMPTLPGEAATHQAALDWVKRQVRGLPLQVHDAVHNGVPSLVLTTRVTKRPKVVLLAHMDVSPGPAELFELQERDGRLYGRGVFDMKLAVATYVRLLWELGERLGEYDLGVMLTCDEEVGGANGVGALVADGWRAGVVVNPDAIGAGGWQIEEMAKGVGRMRVESRGTAGHGSRPWQFRNAVDQLVAFLDELRQHFPAEPCGDPHHFHDTLNVGVLAGGMAINQVPEFARAELDIRITPATSGAEVEQWLNEAASHHVGVTVLVDEVPVLFVVDREDEYVRLMELIITKVVGRQPAFIRSHGGTDSRYFADLAVPNILVSPNGGEAHGRGEWLETKSLEQFYRVVREFVETVGRG